MKTEKDKTGSILSDQRKSIFGLGKEQGLDIDGLRDIARDISGKPSISKLSYNQADKLKRRLAEKKYGPVDRHLKSGGPASCKRQRPGTRSEKLPKNVKKMITGPQKFKIREMYEELGWSLKTFYGWCENEVFYKKDKEGNKIPFEKFRYPSTSEKAHAVISRLAIILKKDRGN